MEVLLGGAEIVGADRRATGLWQACEADVNVFVQVAAPELDACLPFELEYRVTEPGG